MGSDEAGWPDPERINAALSELTAKGGPTERILSAALDGMPGAPEDLAEMAALSAKFWQLRISALPSMVVRDIGAPCAACDKNSSARASLIVMSCGHEALLCLGCLVGDKPLTPQNIAMLWARACRLMPSVHARLWPACSGTVRQGALKATASMFDLRGAAANADAAKKPNP